MRDALLEHYERELSYLRRTGAEFARRYPKVASRLLLEPTKCDDPHVERLLEGFAFLAARIQLKLEDDFPEFSEPLLELLYPHYVRPLPSMSIVHFQLAADQGKLPNGLDVPAEAVLHSRPVGGVPCRFRSCYPTTVWPIDVASARWAAPYELDPPVRAHGAVAALQLDLQAPADFGFDKLQMDSLRLHLNAEPNLAGTLYELLCNNCIEILVRDAAPGSTRDPISLPPGSLRALGFEPDESILPTSNRTFDGYRLLQEYFTIPEKFFFFDLNGFDRVRSAGFGSRVQIVFLISSFERAERRSMLEAGVTADVVRTNCTPIVNLFRQTSEPVLLDHKRHEYLLVADARNRATTGVYSIEQVVAVTAGDPDPVRFEPFFSLRRDRDGSRKRFWMARRRPSRWRSDEGADLHLSFVDGSGRTAAPDCTAVTTRLLCFNGELPSRLPFGDPAGDFEMPGGGPIQRIVTLLKPTSVVHPPLGETQLWKLISQLAINFHSLVAEGADPLRELLRLHNVAESTAGERQIQGILDVRRSYCHARVEGEFGLSFARGQRVEIDFDEEQFAGGGVYLLANVLHHFLGMAVSLNSFCILAARTQQRKGSLAEWPPRSGRRTLI
jgi:type VI secretion system protein ImpG